MTPNDRRPRERERGEGTWLAPTKQHPHRLQISAGYRPDGTRDRKVFGAATRREARAAAAKYLEDKRTGTATLGGATLLRDYLPEWLEARRGRIKASSYRSHESVIRLHIVPALGRLALEDVRRQHVNELMTAVRDKGLSARRANAARSTLNAALADAEADDLVRRNVARGVDRLPHQARRGDPLTAAELTKLLLHVEGTRWYPLYLTTVGLGLRQGEVLGLCWQDVRDDHVLVRHNLQYDNRRKAYYLEATKEDKEAMLPLLPKVRAALDLQRAQAAQERAEAGPTWQGDHVTRDLGDLVFRTRVGRPYLGTTVLRRFQRDLAAAGVRRRVYHDLRHSTSNFLHTMGVPDSIRQGLLRHASISTTVGTYTHTDLAQLREALEALDALL